MKVVVNDAHGDHDPGFFLVRGVLSASREVPERADILAAAAARAGHTLVRPEDFGHRVRAAVHDPEYLDFLETAHDRWKALGDGAGEVIANVFPNRHPASRPESVVGRAGYHMADLACPIGPGTWRAACGAAECAAHAAALVGGGERAAYALCRPPGHHAFSDMAGGFCFLNNTAIAAQELRRRFERVAVLDLDLHHGNGTQQIFYRRADVLHVSIHADPNRFYPFFWGHADERGDGPGAGFTLNLPLPLGSGDEDYLGALARALARIRDFAPGALVVALGLDAYQGDPFAALAVTTGGFGDIAAAVAGLGLPTVLVQEGGYVCRELGDNLNAVLAAF